MTPALMAALPPRAALALALARLRDPCVDEACAWLVAHDHPEDTIERLARRMRATARRDRRAGGAHGPAWFASPAEGCDALAQQGGEDPAALIEGCEEAQEQMQQAGIVLHDPELASDTAALAQAYGRTRRRMQQVQAARAAAEAAGQAELFA
ncbi:MAG: hypothetical protein AB7S55_00705 [Thiomonas sp.]